MSLAETKWPLRKIVWGIWFNSMHSFIHARKGEKDHFETQIEATEYRDKMYSIKQIRKDGIEIRPIKRLGQNTYDEEDV